MKDLIEYLKSKLKNLNDIYFRELNIKGKKVYIVFSDALVDSNLVSNYVVRSIVEIKLLLVFFLRIVILIMWQV